MKKVFLMLISVALVFATAHAQDNTAKEQPAEQVKVEMAQFNWVDGTTHDFGKIEQGKPVTFVFKFTNTGKVPLVITDVRPSCGCTAADYTREPIAVGKEGYIKATYNAASAGAFSKTVNIQANIEGQAVPLVIKGEVTVKQ
jgi:hypothetical protein